MTATATATDKPADATNPTPAITLDNSNDYSLVERELNGAAESLSTLAKKNDDAGYPREARRIRMDADSLTHRIAPRFKPQSALDLSTDGLELSDVIERMLLDDIRRACKAASKQAKSQAKSDQPPTEGDDLESIVTRCAKKIALRIADFGNECAARGIWAGQAVREIEEGDVVRRASEKLQAPATE